MTNRWSSERISPLLALGLLVVMLASVSILVTLLFAIFGKRLSSFCER